MKLLFEIITLVLFFAVYQIYDLNKAILVVIIAYTLFTAFTLLKHKRLSKSQIATFLLVVVLGGATLLLDNELFFKWKPTVVCWLFASVLLGSYMFSKQNLLQRLGGDNFKLPDNIWKRLNFIWIAFFLFMGGINLFVAYNFDTTTWVYFKLFGAVGLLISFMLAQVICLWKYIHE
jgi:intracellular septation protein